MTRYNIQPEEKDKKSAKRYVPKISPVSDNPAFQAHSLFNNATQRPEGEVNPATTPASLFNNVEEEVNPAVKPVELITGANTEQNPALRKLSLFGGFEKTPEEEVNVPSLSELQEAVGRPVVAQPAVTQPGEVQVEKQLLENEDELVIDQIVDYLESLKLKLKEKQAVGV